MKHSFSAAEINRLVTLAPETIAAMPYEEAMATLEQVVEALEGEGTPLALGLKLYEVGTALSRKCAGDLDSSEARMCQLLGEGPNSRDVPFDPETEGR